MTPESMLKKYKNIENIVKLLKYLVFDKMWKNKITLRKQCKKLKNYNETMKISMKLFKKMEINKEIVNLIKYFIFK